MFFKGGTSLSKGWNLIDRFSEDIDIALYRDFYFNELGKDCAKAATNNQVKNLRIVNRDYILGEFAKELKSKLVEAGLGECKVLPITTKKDGSPIDHDSDPVIIEIHYPVKVDSDAFVRPVVRIEISCLSMKEPFEVKRISSLVGNAFPEIDDETFAEIPTITPIDTQNSVRIILYVFKHITGFPDGFYDTPPHHSDRQVSWQKLLYRTS